MMTRKSNLVSFAKQGIILKI